MKGEPMKVKLVNVSKRIHGSPVLQNVSYEFDDSTIYGLTGSNGSGKTMLIRAIAGLLIPTSGEVIINGDVLHQKADFPERMGITIGNIVFPKDLTGFQNLVALSKLNKIATIEQIKNAFKKVGLNEEDWNIKVSDYSLGMRQKLSIAQAIFENPKLLLLDEPTNGLDEESTWILRNTLKEIAQGGSTVIIASHDKEDIAYLSDEVIQIDGGKIVNQK